MQNEVFMRVEESKKNCIKHQGRIKSYLHVEALSDLPKREGDTAFLKSYPKAAG